jgi:transposase InsO family protein
LRFSSLTTLGVANITIKQALQRNSQSWQAIPDPQDARRRLIAYEPLADKYKQMIHARYGDPYRWIKTQFISNRLEDREEDIQLINDFRTDQGEQLSQNKRSAYRLACSLLAFLDNLPRLSKSVVKGFGFSSASDFWQSVYQYIKGHNICLPSSDRLKRKLKEYQKNGAIAVFHGGLGNKNSRKVDKTALAIIIKLMQDEYGRKFSKKEVWRQFKAVAQKHNIQGVEDVTYQCIWRYINKNEHLWYAGRHGNKEFMLKKELVINQEKASQPHLQWQIDGTPDPLWYYDPIRKTLDKLYVMVVMDSHSDAIVGYAFGESETMNLVFAALKMAIKVHGVKPHELRSDNGSAMKGGETRALLRQLGVRFKPSKVGRARARTIEREQGGWMHNACQYFINKSGANITARSMDAKQNAEKVKQYYKEYPSKEELMEQLHLSIALHNNWSIEGKRTRKERLGDACPDARKVDTHEIMERFYVYRKKGAKYMTYRLTSEGLTMQVAKKEYKYLPQVADATEMANFINKHNNYTKFYIKYDPSDLEQVGLYVLPESAPKEDEEYFRFLEWGCTKAKAKQFEGDATDEDKALLAYYQTVQTEQRAQVEQELEEQRAELDALNILTGSIDIQDVRKDDYNAAKIDVQRLQALGYTNTTLNQDQEQYLEPIETPSSNAKEDKEVDIYDGDFDISSLLDL